jgi:transposase
MQYISDMQESVLLQEIQDLKDKNKALLAIINQLTEELAYLRRQIFGQKTERFIPEASLQTQLALGVVAPTAAPAQTVTVAAHERKVTKNKNHPGRDEISADIPRVVIEVKPDFDTTGMEKIGEKITERLEYTPPKFFVNKYVLAVYRKVENKISTLINTPAPSLCIEKGKLGASIVAHAMLSKCEDHLPIYRIAKMLSRDAGDVIAESTLRDAFRQGASLIEAVVHRMRTIAMASTYLQMDESTIKVVIQPSQGKSHQGYMIVSHAPLERIVLFEYRKTRNVKLIKDHLREFKGILQTDGLDLYVTICKELELPHAGCMDHCRRGFEKAGDGNKEKSQWALQQMQKLYAVEREAREAKLTADARYQLRRHKSRQLFDEFIAWCNEQILCETPKSYLGKALAYTLNRIDELGFFLGNGSVEMSNILIENAIRPLAVGRKNYLLCGSEPAAQRLATVYSIVSTCRFHEVNVREYLNDVLNQLPARMSKNIDDLLPWNWAKKHAPIASE